MKFDDLVNEVLQHQKNNLIVIFPGRFQPFHVGHKKLYDMAKKQFPGADFFIATADEVAKKDDLSRYPFNFAEKKEIIKATGIPENEIALVRQPYKPIEILSSYDQNIAKVIYIVGKKDMETDPRFKFGMTKKGTPTYFQPFTDLQSMQPFKEQGGHGYIYAPATLEFDLGGKQITSATELRNMYKGANEVQRKEYIKQILGNFNPKIYELFNSKLS
jgi:cytidyltransferase-like protein